MQSHVLKADILDIFACVSVNIVDDLAAKTRKLLFFVSNLEMCRPLHFARREFHKEQSKKSFIG